jgi:surface antigen
MNKQTITPAERGFKAPARIAMLWHVATLGALAAAAIGAAAAPASARTSVFIGAPVYVAPPYPPPVVYAPRSVYVAPAPAYVAAAPIYAAPACHQYKTSVTVGRITRQVSGTACRQPDGSWRVAN